MNPLILIGGGGHCLSCIDVIESERKFKIEGIVDKKEKRGQKVLGYEIIASDEDFHFLQKEFKNFHITVGQIGSSQPRIKIYTELKRFDVHFPVIVSPLAYVSKHSRISEGSIIMHHAIVNAHASVGKICIINTKALVEHDATIGDFCHIATGAIVNGETQVGCNSFIGSGAVTKQTSIVPENSFVKANSIYNS